MSESGSNAEVLVVIPCLNEQAHLPGLLDAVLSEAAGARVVVADGGSVDRSREIVRALVHDHPNLILLDNPRRIQSAGVNLAVQRYGRGRRWLVRMDAHAGYPPGFIDRLRLSADSMRATSVVVPMVTQGGTCFQKAAAAAQNSVLGTGGAPHRRPGRGRWVDHGHHALLEMRPFMAVGGYDENFAANEDAELDRRLLAAGGCIWLEPQATIVYHPRRTGRALFRQYRQYGRGRARNLRRHPVPVRLRQMLPLSVVPAIVVALVGIALGHVAGGAGLSFLLALPAIAWAMGSLLLGLFLGWRAGSLCDAGSGIAAMIMHAAWSLGFIEEATILRRRPEPPSPLEFEECIPDWDEAAFEAVAPSARPGIGPGMMVL